MKSTSQITDCIACGSKDITLVPMWFMAEQAQFPICGACAPYVERVFTNPSIGLARMQFLGVTDIPQVHQQGGAFSCMVPDSSLPPDFASRLEDFDLHCAFIGQRIRELRSIETDSPR